MLEENTYIFTLWSGDSYFGMETVKATSFNQALELIKSTILGTIGISFKYEKSIQC